MNIERQLPEQQSSNESSEEEVDIIFISSFDELEITLNTNNIPKGTLIAKIVWTEQWAEDQPYVSISDHADFNYNNFKLNSTTSNQRDIIVGERL